MEELGEESRKAWVGEHVHHTLDAPQDQIAVRFGLEGKVKEAGRRGVLIGMFGLKEGVNEEK